MSRGLPYGCRAPADSFTQSTFAYKPVSKMPIPAGTIRKKHFNGR